MAQRDMNRIGRLWRSDESGLSPVPMNQTSSADAIRKGQSDENNYATIGLTQDYYGYYEDTLRILNTRRENFRLYDQMDNDMPELTSALDIFADNVTQVGLTKSDAKQNKDHIVQIVTKDERVAELLSETRDHTQMDSRAWALARDLAKYGEVFEEQVVSFKGSKVDRLKTLPARYVLRNENEFGLFDDPKKAYVQVDKTFERTVALFEDWEMAHYRLRRRNSDRYGTSILHPVRRVYKQLQMIEDSMILARLTRANTRYVFRVDTGTLPPAMAHEHVQRVKKEYQKRRMFDRSGNLRTDLNPMGTEEDIFLGVARGSQANVDQLYGDLNIGNLEDVYYFQDKMFGALKVPKSYLGIERDVSSKATLTTQDIQFARSVRRIQQAMRAGYAHTFNLALKLAGKADSEFTVVLPAMQTIDELRSWEVERIKAEVARIWMQELYLDETSVLVHLLGYSEEEAKKLFKGSASEFAKMEKNRNSAKSFKSSEDKKFNQKVREAIEDGERDADTVIADLRMLYEMSAESDSQQGYLF